MAPFCEFERRDVREAWAQLPIKEQGRILGFIDGEGSVFFHSSGGAVPAHYPAVRITNTDARMMKYMHGALGGTVYASWPSNLNAKKTYIWEIRGPMALEFAPFLEDELLLKTEQARLIGQWTSNKVPNELIDEVRTLNRRGVTVGAA